MCVLACGCVGVRACGCDNNNSSERETVEKETGLGVRERVCFSVEMPEKIEQVCACACDCVCVRA